MLTREQKIACFLLIASLLAAASASAADEPEKKPASSSKVEHMFKKTEKALGKTADKVEGSVKKGAAATEKALESAGKKTSE
jgi:hypothetical protein